MRARRLLCLCFLYRRPSLNLQNPKPYTGNPLQSLNSKPPELLIPQNPKALTAEVAKGVYSVLYCLFVAWGFVSRVQDVKFMLTG